MYCSYEGGGFRYLFLFTREDSHFDSCVFLDGWFYHQLVTSCSLWGIEKKLLTIHKGMYLAKLYNSPT